MQQNMVPLPEENFYGKNTLTIRNDGPNPCVPRVRGTAYTFDAEGSTVQVPWTHAHILLGEPNLVCVMDDGQILDAPLTDPATAKGEAVKPEPIKEKAEKIEPAEPVKEAELVKEAEPKSGKTSSKRTKKESENGRTTAA